VLTTHRPVSPTQHHCFPCWQIVVLLPAGPSLLSHHGGARGVRADERSSRPTQEPEANQVHSKVMATNPDDSRPLEGLGEKRQFRQRIAVAEAVLSG